MRGSVFNQVYTVFGSLNRIGESRHAAKEAARSGDALGASQLAAKTGIHSYATLDSYRAIAVDCFSYIKDEFGVKDISKIDGSQVASFLKDKTENGASFNTVKTYSAALGKLEAALNTYFKTDEYSFKSAIAESKTGIEKPVLESRALVHPRAVIDSLSNPAHQLVAALQYEHGLRVAEASHINLDKQLENNTITIQGKGGYLLSKELTDKQVAELKNLAVDGVFRASYNNYLRDLKEACKANFETYSGSHAFRHTYAQERYNELLSEGATVHEAKLTVSEELGHHRVDIVDVYLR